MGETNLDIREGRFWINHRPTYEEIPASPPDVRGLLMNARFIQGIFDDAADRTRYIRWGRDRFDPDENTNELIEALPQWKSYGLRAFTVGFQGGGPCFTVPNSEIDNNPFGRDGRRLDPSYAARMDRLIRGADAAGIVVNVSFLYQGQIGRLDGEEAVRSAVTVASRFLRDGSYSNVMIEVANENDVGPYEPYPIIHQPEGMARLIDLARKESGGLPVGCSGGGGYLAREIVQSSDVVLFHGNGCSRQRFYKMICSIREWAPDKPAVCNEDSQALANMQVAVDCTASWGYYNNMTKQEPPTDWRVLPGEDRFFAHRMAQRLGIPVPDLPDAEQHYLAGFEPAMSYGGRRWIRLAALYPERIDRVIFHRNGRPFYTSYDQPFTVYFDSNWHQVGVTGTDEDQEWKAEIRFINGGKLFVPWNR